MAASADAQPMAGQAAEVARLEHRVALAVHEEARVDKVERFELAQSGVVCPVVVDRLSIDPVTQVRDCLGPQTAAEQALRELNRGQLRITPDQVVDTVEARHDLLSEARGCQAT